MTLFRNKFRVESTRLKGWDYASAGGYFVTICTRGRERFFGEVANRRMGLSAVGAAAMFWGDISRHFPHVTVDAFVVMPDHVHGIIIINSPKTPVPVIETRHVASLPADVTPPPADIAPLPADVAPPPSQPAAFGPLQPGSLSKIIQAFKASVTRWCRENGHPEFAWQPRFYDCIIRDEAALARIRRYILDNPAKWELKENAPDGIWV